MFVILYTLPNTSWYQVQFLSATQSYPIYLTILHYFCQGFDVGFDVCRSCRWRWRVYSWTHVTWCIDGAQIIPPFVWKPSLYPLQGTRFMHEHNLVKHQASSVKHHQVNWLVQLGGPWLLYMYILKGLLLLLLVIFLLGVFVGCSSRSGPLL